MKREILRALLALGVGAFALLIAGAASAQISPASQSNCGIVKSRISACIFQNTVNPGAAVEGTAKPAKTGRACAFNVLGLVALGDVRPSTAARNGGITKIASVDTEAFEIVPGPNFYKLYGRFCTVVKGE